ncbi:MAG: MFS transporter [Lachnospiraceae bacterium]|nr:MFS transporter [Lachnospiraceae bacterium]
MYALLLAVIYLAFISLGLPDSLLGAGWPVMHEYFGVSLSSAGIVSMLISGGTIVSSLASERITKKLGTKYVTLLSVALTSAALFGFSISTGFFMICLWAIPYGLGAGSIDAALNNYVALHYNSRHMSWLHCFWGVGTIISPYVMSCALTYSNWQTGYKSVAGIQLCIAVVLLATLRLWRINEGENISEIAVGKVNITERKSDNDCANDRESGNIAESTDSDDRILGLSGAVKIKGVPDMLTGFMCYCSAESTCMLWTASYLIKMRGVRAEKAAAFASLFFIGMTVGRFLAGFIATRLGDRNMIRLGACIMAVGIVLIAITALPEMAVLGGFVIIGLGCAPIYPSIIHSTPSNFGAENSQAIIGIQMASAYVGSTLAPPIFGLLSSVVGMWIMPAYITLFAVVMIVMLERTFNITKS